MGLHENQMLFFSKEKYKQSKDIAQKQDKLFTSHTSDKRQITRNWKELQKSNTKEIKLPINKWAD